MRHDVVVVVCFWTGSANNPVLWIFCKVLRLLLHAIASVFTPSYLLEAPGGCIGVVFIIPEREFLTLRWCELLLSLCRNVELVHHLILLNLSLLLLIALCWHVETESILLHTCNASRIGRLRALPLLLVSRCCTSTMVVVWEIVSVGHIVGHCAVGAFCGKSTLCSSRISLRLVIFIVVLVCQFKLLNILCYTPVALALLNRIQCFLWFCFCLCCTFFVRHIFFTALLLLFIMVLLRIQILAWLDWVKLFRCPLCTSLSSCASQVLLRLLACWSHLLLGTAQSLLRSWSQSILLLQKTSTQLIILFWVLLLIFLNQQFCKINRIPCVRNES
jgi:hypothetical protein